ncbi:MAG TPA: ribonuclease J [Candidatus Paceibacterota bacterium]|nr:ribonuclease J [Candidatus Paceibacterota bacterium]
MEQNNNSSPEIILASARPAQRRGNVGTGTSRRQERDHKRRWMKPTVRRVKVLGRGPVGGGSAYGGEEAERSKVGGLKIVHLGGLGEIGRNMSAVQYDDEIILIDAGISFPNEQMPGIDFILPNVGYLAGKEHMVKAMFFTHGHMDHTGALPFILDKIGDPDFYAAALTRALIIKRLEEYKDRKPVNIIQIEAGDEIKISDKLSVKVLRVSHSIPDDLQIVISTPLGKIVHTSDFKFDETPVNDKPAQIEEMQRMGDAKEVLLMMSDSTGAENEGHSLSEQDITKNMEKIFTDATGMLIIGTFASLINRIQQTITISEKFGRKIVVDGYSMKTNVEITKKLGYLKMQKGTQISMDEIDRYPREKVTVICTGAQGEGNAVLMRIANGEHRHILPRKNDTFVFSSSVIPGNERNVQFLKDQLYRNGVRVYNYRMMDIHAGGHGNKEDLRTMLKLIRPKFLMPIHGQYSMMVNHGFLGNEEGIPEENVIIADNGTIVNLEKDKFWFDKERAPFDYVFVDGLGVGDIGNVVLRDRQILSEDGMFVVVALVDHATHTVIGSPDIISRGFIYLKENKELLMQVRKKIRQIVESQKSAHELNMADLRDQLRNQIGLFLFQKTQRRPMVLPVVIEV